MAKNRPNTGNGNLALIKRDQERRRSNAGGAHGPRNQRRAERRTTRQALRQGRWE